MVDPRSGDSVWNTPERAEGLWKFCKAQTDFKEKTVLDIGCNKGYLSEKAHLAGAKKITGIDIVKHYTNLASERVPTGKFYDGDLFNMSWPSVDVALCCGVIYHVDKQLLLLQRLKEAAPLIILEGMCNQKPDCVLQCVHHETHSTWSPSWSYYQMLFDATGLKVLASEDRGPRAIFSLTSN